MSREFEKAKQIVIEIIRCSDGVVECKTRLFKIFYYAHLIYARNFPDYLSEWPIVRMPNGPGIGDSDLLINALAQEGRLEIRKKHIGPYIGYEYRTSAAGAPPALDADAVAAIREAVDFAKNRTSSELSEITHEYSNSWRDSKDGDRLNIYVDLLDDEAYGELKAKVERGVADMRAIFG